MWLSYHQGAGGLLDKWCPSFSSQAPDHPSGPLAMAPVSKATLSIKFAPSSGVFASVKSHVLRKFPEVSELLLIQFLFCLLDQAPPNLSHEDGALLYFPGSHQYVLVGLCSPFEV